MILLLLLLPTVVVGVVVVAVLCPSRKTDRQLAFRTLSQSHRARAVYLPAWCVSRCDIITIIAYNNIIGILLLYLYVFLARGEISHRRVVLHNCPPYFRVSNVHHDQ